MAPFHSAPRGSGDATAPDPIRPPTGLRPVPGRARHVSARVRDGGGRTAMRLGQCPKCMQSALRAAAAARVIARLAAAMARPSGPGAKLSRNWRMVRAYYGLDGAGGGTYKGVAKVFGVTVERARQVILRQLADLRRAADAAGITYGAV